LDQTKAREMARGVPLYMHLGESKSMEKNPTKIEVFKMERVVGERERHSFGVERRKKVDGARGERGPSQLNCMRW
jgi:hypothetical protein